MSARLFMPQPLARDTSPGAEARQIAFFQQRQPHERLAIVFDLTAFAVASARAAIRRAHPQLSPLEQARLAASLWFGPEYAVRVRQPPTIEGIMSISAALLPITRVFQQLQIAYYVGGSIASTAYSLPRSTYDIDMAAAMEPQHIATFVAALEADYYIDRGSILDAIARAEASFNITHHATGINIDIFVTADRPFDRSRYRRAQDHLLPGASEPIKLASPEDMVLNKLLWFWQDEIASEKQWRDAQGIIRVQAEALDLGYLRTWATNLNIAPLLEAALRGDPPPRPQKGADDPQQGRLF
jgi:hypothetical protein